MWSWVESTIRDALPFPGTQGKAKY
jgi:hypothetical protein